MPNRVGCAWNRKDKKGQEYIAIMVNNVRYLMFTNQRKKADTHPDWVIFEKLTEEEQKQREGGKNGGEEKSASKS